MKKIIFFLLLVGFVVPGNGEEIRLIEKQKNFCPRTKISDQAQCVNCHSVPSFRLKEAPANEGYRYPDWIKTIANERVGFFMLEDIRSEPVQEFYEYLERHGINKAIIEIFSPGGSMMQGWRVVNIIENFDKIRTTTIIKGYAASAGFLVFIAGKQRQISSTALLMWHEVQTFRIFDISSPSDKEEEARVLRLFQDNANEWISSRSKVSKDKLDSMIKKKEWWITGKQAVEMGLADGLLEGR